MDKDYSFTIGSKIFLRKLNSKDRRIYPSQVLDITDQGEIIVSGPIYKNRKILMGEGKLLEFSFIIEDKGKCYFNTRVLKKDFKDPYKLKLERISDFGRLQLRFYYRFEIDIPVTKEWAMQTDEGLETIIENCRLKDISGGGLKIYSNHKHEIADKIICKFFINGKEIIANGKIIRVEQIDTFKYDYALGVEFMKIDEKNRDRIIKFIFSSQRELREKGLI